MSKGWYRKAQTLEDVVPEAMQEIRQPLLVVSANLEMVLQGRFGSLSSEQDRLLREAFEACERIGRIADSLDRISGPPEDLKPDDDIRRMFGE